MSSDPDATRILTEDGEVVASNVDYATGFFSKMKGLMFRRSIPDDYALVFEFDKEKKVSLHMLFVPFSIDAVFLDPENRVNESKTLRAWLGVGSGKAKRVIELPEGTSSGISEGDRLLFQNENVS